MTFTASARERIQRCPASAVLPQINSSSEWSEGGNDAHDVVCVFVSQLREGMSEGAALANAPSEWQTLCEELIPLARHLRPELALAIQVETQEARVLGENIKRRYSLRDLEVAGTADLAGVIDGVAVVADLKTGWGAVTRPERNPQLRLLALMAARAWGCDQAKVAVLVCREGQEPRWQWAELEAWDLDEVAAELRDEYACVAAAQVVVQEGRVPSVSEGAHCKYCPATPCCPAKTALLKRLASGAEGDELELMIPLNARTAGVAWERLQLARSMLKRIESACHAALDEFGQLELPSGRLLKKVVTDGNERIDGMRAYQLLVDMMGRDVAENAVEYRMTKKALGEALRRMLGRGGAAKERELLEEMRRRGIVERGTTEKLVEIDAGESAA